MADMKWGTSAVRIRIFLTFLFGVTLTSISFAQRQGPVREEEITSAQSTIHQMINAAMVNGGLDNEEQVLKMKAYIETLNIRKRIGHGARKIARQYNEIGLKYIQARQFKDAVQAFEAAYQADIADVEIVDNLGYAYLHHGDVKAAEETLLIALIFAPGRSSAWASLAQAYAKQTKKKEALACFANMYHFSRDRDNTRKFFDRLLEDSDERVRDAAREALQLRLVQADHSLNKGIAHISQGQYDEAIAELTKSIEFKAKSAEAFNSRAIAYSAKGLSTQALADYTRAIELNPKYVEAYYNRGSIFQETNQYDKSISDYTTALKLYPSLIHAYNNRGLVYQEMGQYKQAIADFTKALELNSNDAILYINRGNVFSRAGNIGRACHDWKRACDLGNCEAYQSGNC